MGRAVCHCTIVATAGLTTRAAIANTVALFCGASQASQASGIAARHRRAVSDVMRVMHLHVTRLPRLAIVGNQRADRKHAL